jgi:hypothetical protein
VRRISWEESRAPSSPLDVRGLKACERWPAAFLGEDWKLVLSANIIRNSWLWRLKHSRGDAILATMERFNSSCEKSGPKIDEATPPLVRPLSMYLFSSSHDVPFYLS